MISPGTSSLAAMSCTHLPSRRQRVVSGCSFSRASSADCAERSCHVPTTALRRRMPRMTAGSTQPLASPSSAASPYDSAATHSRICTSLSSNCAAKSFHRGSFSAAASLLGPYWARSWPARDSLSPCSGETSTRVRYAATSLACAGRKDGTSTSVGELATAPPRSVPSAASAGRGSRLGGCDNRDTASGGEAAAHAATSSSRALRSSADPIAEFLVTPGCIL